MRPPPLYRWSAGGGPERGEGFYRRLPSPVVAGCSAPVPLTLDLGNGNGNGIVLGVKDKSAVLRGTGRTV
ncbi:hypothetical protein HC256_002834 [Beauveria bassiana]|nr:hypothetical protein HC256_002834 [Beauveria bassiana]